MLNCVVRRGFKHGISFEQRDTGGLHASQHRCPDSGSTEHRSCRSRSHQGAVSVAFALGGLPSDHNAFHPAWEFDSSAVEGAVADFMGLVRAGGLGLGSTDYEVRVGIERGGPERMIMHTLNNFGHRYSDASTPMHWFAPVEATVEVAVSDERWLHQVRELVRDCINQGGLTSLQTLVSCTCEECTTEQ